MCEHFEVENFLSSEHIEECKPVKTLVFAKFREKFKSKRHRVNFVAIK